MIDEVRLRPARPDEAGSISELALRSKGYWGYDAEFLAACRADLTVDPAWCDGRTLVVAQRSGALLGYCRVCGAPPVGELDALFVEPSAIGQGIGAALMNWARGCAADLGMTRLSIDSDPYAEPFYRRAGAVRVGESASTALAGRMLPRLELYLDRESANS